VRPGADRLLVDLDTTARLFVGPTTDDLDEVDPLDVVAVADTPGNLGIWTVPPLQRDHVHELRGDGNPRRLGLLDDEADVPDPRVPGVVGAVWERGRGPCPVDRLAVDFEAFAGFGQRIELQVAPSADFRSSETAVWWLEGDDALVPRLASDEANWVRARTWTVDLEASDWSEPEAVACGCRQARPGTAFLALLLPLVVRRRR
jgi:hypothetical protein